MEEKKIDSQSDLLVFKQEPSVSPPAFKEQEWTILIVDDEEDIHRVTKLVLSNFKFQNKKIEFLSAYSATEAKIILAQRKDIAIALLDVVMESDSAGLELIKYIRNEIGNKFVRIILRTGQPGQAPESNIIIDYDINDYKTKTELTEQKLITTVVSSLRSYTDLLALDFNRKGLEKIIEGTRDVFEVQSLQKLSNGILTQIAGLLCLESDLMFCRISGLAACVEGEEIRIVAGTGKFEEQMNKTVHNVLSSEKTLLINKVIAEQRSIYTETEYIGFFCSSKGSQNIIYIENYNALGETEKRLLEVFGSNVSIAFDNLYLNIELESSQKEIIFVLGELIDMRSNETGSHVRRVGEYSKLLALKVGMPEADAEVIRIASAMHDIGKLGIPDTILNKESRLTSDEFEAMKEHSNIGAGLLNHSNRNILKTASIIAIQHHERYDGSGYPCGLSGSEIHHAARITAIADVFDALSHDRIYRPMLPRNKIVEYFNGADSVKFDPKYLAVFLENLDMFYEIKETY